MCQFCVEHGEGERWYLNAKNYAHDLQSDLERRDYVVRFIADFGANRARAIRWLDAASVLPKPLRKTATAVASRRMQPHHFGQPVPIEECEQIFSLATSITVIPCICRMHAPGKNADEVCVLVTTQPMETYLAEGFRDYEDGPELGDFHKMSRDEAMDLLRECESKGLMHSVWTFETPFTAAICNCNLESGCMAMRLTAGYEMKMMWRGESVAIRDPDLCTVCGRCAKICPFEAIASAPSHVEVQADRCWGCGICRSVCRADALTLVDRRTIPAVATLW